MPPNDSEAELRNILLTMQEEQILSAYDTVLLLLLPLATFLVAASFWNIPRLLAGMAPPFAAVFVCVLAYLVHAKLAGNDGHRVLAWFYFFLSSSAALAFTIFLWAVSLIVGVPIGIDLIAELILGFPGILAVTYGLTYAPTRWIKRTLQRRLPRRSVEIEQVFFEWKREVKILRIALIPHHDLLVFSIGTALLLVFARTGIDNFPSELYELVDVLAFVSVALAVLVTITSWILRRRMRKRTVKASCPETRPLLADGLTASAYSSISFFKVGTGCPFPRLWRWWSSLSMPRAYSL